MVRLVETNTRPLDAFDYRYRGLTVPIIKKARGYFQTSNSRDVIRSDMHLLLTTSVGERVMLPTYGSRLPSLIFEPNDAVTRSLIQQVVAEDLQKWEPRINATNISISFSDDGHQLSVAIAYNILTLQSDDMLVLIFNRASN